MGSRDAALELLSDGHTTAPLIRLGYLHSLRGGRSYFLHFKHQSGERDFPLVRINTSPLVFSFINVYIKVWFRCTIGNKNTHKQCDIVECFDLLIIIDDV